MHPTQLKKTSNRRRRKFNPVVLLVLPAITVLFVFSIYPILKYVPAAFFNWRPPQQLSDAKFVGFKWFKDLLGYYKLPQLIRNSLILGLWDIALLPIPMFLALASEHCNSVRLKKGLEVFSLIPVFIPSVVVVAVTQRILSTEGLLNQFLTLWGVQGENWLLNGELFYAYFSISTLWSSLGFPYLVYKACLSSKSTELHAAAQLDGASLLVRIIRIDLPLCMSTFLLNLIMKIAGILNTSTERLLLFSNTANNSYATTLDLYAYELTFKSSMMPSYSKSIALSLMITLINIFLLLIAKKITSKKEHIYD